MFAIPVLILPLLLLHSVVAQDENVYGTAVVVPTGADITLVCPLQQSLPKNPALDGWFYHKNHISGYEQGQKQPAYVADHEVTYTSNNTHSFMKITRANTLISGDVFTCRSGNTTEAYIVMVMRSGWHCSACWEASPDRALIMTCAIHSQGLTKDLFMYHMVHKATETGKHIYVTKSYIHQQQNTVILVDYIRAKNLSGLETTIYTSSVGSRTLNVPHLHQVKFYKGSQSTDSSETVYLDVSSSEQCFPTASSSDKGSGEN